LKFSDLTEVYKITGKEKLSQLFNPNSVSCSIDLQKQNEQQPALQNLRSQNADTVHTTETHIPIIRTYENATIQANTRPTTLEAWTGTNIQEMQPGNSDFTC